MALVCVIGVPPFRALTVARIRAWHGHLPEIHLVSDVVERQSGFKHLAGV